MSLQTEIHFANTGPQSEICVFVFFTVFLKEGKFLVQTKSSSLLFFLMEYAFLCVSDKLSPDPRFSAMFSFRSSGLRSLRVCFYIW